MAKPDKGSGSGEDAEWQGESKRVSPPRFSPLISGMKERKEEKKRGKRKKGERRGPNPTHLLHTSLNSNTQHQAKQKSKAAAARRDKTKSFFLPSALYDFRV